MKLEDVKVLTQQALAQSMGTDYMVQNGYLEGIPAEKLVDIGTDIEDMGATERYTKALVSLMAKFECTTLGYEMMFSDIVVDRIEWGGFVQRAKIDIADVYDDPMSAPVNKQSYAELEHTFFQPKVTAKVYEEGKPLMIPISISADTLKESFRSWDALNGFLSQIRESIRETRDMVLDSWANVLVNSAIAESCKATGTEVKLKTMAVADKVAGVSSSDTPEKLLLNKDFLAYASEKIGVIRSNMKARTNVYNNKRLSVGAIQQNAYFLTPFIKARNNGLLADTYNREERDIGKFVEIPRWQAVKGETADTTPFGFSDVSSISFSADSTNSLGLGTEAVTLNNIIGVVFDKRALGICAFREKMTTNYTASADFWNEYLHLLVNYILDTDYNIVAFSLN